MKILKDAIERFRLDSRGNIAIGFAIISVPMLITAGAAVDYSQAWRVKSTAQGYLDSATLTAASASGLSDKERKKLLVKFFKANVKMDGSLPRKIRNPKVRIKDDVIHSSLSIRVPTSLLAVAGMKKINTNLLSAVKMTSTGGSNCVMSQSFSVSGSMRIDPTCGFHVSGTKIRDFSIGGSFANHNTKVSVAGGFSGVAAFNPVASGVPPQLPVSPLPTGTTISPGACEDIATPVTVTGGGTTNIGPGTYCDKWDLQSGELHLSPGIYILKQSIDVSAGVVIRGSGVSVIFTDKARFNIDTKGSGSGLDYFVTPPLNGTFKDILIYQDASAAGNKNVVKGSLEFSNGFYGIVYLPDQDFDMLGAFAFKTTKGAAFVARHVKIRGAMHWHIPDDSFASISPGGSGAPMFIK